VHATAAWIVEKGAPPVSTSDPLRPAQVGQLDPVRQLRSARYIRAARKPNEAMQRLAEGTGTIEDRETLDALYPAMFRAFGERVLAKARKSKQPLTYRERQRLHFATGLPFSADQVPGAMRRIRRIEAEKAAEAEQLMRQPPPQRPRSVKGLRSGGFGARS